MKAKSLPFIALEHKRFVTSAAPAMLPLPRARAHLGAVLGGPSALPRVFLPEFPMLLLPRETSACVLFTRPFFLGAVIYFYARGSRSVAGHWGRNLGNAAARSPRC